MNYIDAHHDDLKLIVLKSTGTRVEEFQIMTTSIKVNFALPCWPNTRHVTTNRTVGWYVNVTDAFGMKFTIL